MISVPNGTLRTHLILCSAVTLLRCIFTSQIANHTESSCKTKSVNNSSVRDRYTRPSHI